MGTQDTGRKRIPNRDRLTAEDDALNLIARQAEARLAAKRAARAEAREIRMRELEKQQNETSDDEERMSVGSRGSLRVDDRSDLLEKGSRAASTLASLSRASSRRGSGDASTWADGEASVREIKDSLTELEDKYRKAMVFNAQLDNEKSKLMYQVDVLKDSLMELEELLSESRREYEDKAKEFEREKHAHSILQFQFSEMKEMLRQGEELLTKHGIVLGPDLNANGETGAVIDRLANAESAARLTQDSQPTHAGESMLEIRLRKLVDERENLVEQVKRLKAQLDHKQNGKEDGAAPGEEGLQNGTNPHILDIQRDANRQMSELKFKLVKSEQEVAALEQNVIRLEAQVTRYKTASENAERIEDDLKADKRKLQRELRSALDKAEELEASNSLLTKRLEKMKANRSPAFAQQ